MLCSRLIERRRESYLNIIRVKSSVHEPLRNIIDNVRLAVSKVCGGVDDMNRLGNKALVVRAEIYPRKLPMLYAALESIQVNVSQHSLPDLGGFAEDTEYPMTLQVTSLADDTDDRVNLPRVPG